MSTVVLEPSGQPFPPGVPVDPELQTQALTTVARANQIKVVDVDTRTIAAEMGITVARDIKTVEEYFGPMKRAAKKTHEEICKAEHRLIDPLEEAKSNLSVEIGKFDLAEENRRRELEKRLNAEQQKAAEEQAAQAAQEVAILDAIELEAQGDKATAEAVLNHPVAQPVFVPPIAVARETPKVAGVGRSTKWKFVVEKPELVPDTYWVLDEKAIQGVVNALKDKTDIPGIKVYPEGGARFRA